MEGKHCHREHSVGIVKDMLCKQETIKQRPEGKKNQPCNAGWTGEGRAFWAEERVGGGPTTAKNRHCTDIWVLRIWMVFLVGCGIPGTWCHKGTDLNGLQGELRWAF